MDEEIEPGVVQRRLHSLPLLNSSTLQLNVTAGLSHVLSGESPLVRFGLEAIQRASGASLEGQVFADLVSEDANGLRRVNLDALRSTRAIG